MNNLCINAMNIIATIDNVNVDWKYPSPFKMTVSHETYLGLVIIAIKTQKQFKYHERFSLTMVNDWINSTTPYWLASKEQTEFEKYCTSIGSRVMKILNRMSVDEILSNEFILYAGTYADYIREIQAYIVAANRAAAMR